MVKLTTNKQYQKHFLANDDAHFEICIDPATL